MNDLKKKIPRAHNNMTLLFGCKKTRLARIRASSTIHPKPTRRDDANPPRSGGTGDDVFTAFLHRAERLGGRLARRRAASPILTRGHREPTARARRGG